MTHSLRVINVTHLKEIRDASETAFPNLVADMNANEDKWDSVTGARQGSTSSKEQEGFIWDRNKFSLEEVYDFDDTQGQDFTCKSLEFITEHIESKNYKNFEK